MLVNEAQLTSDDDERVAGASGGDGDFMERILARSGRLYSLPAVAMEVLRLTSDPRINVAELTACIQRDPALTAKILRVVNSSLYGLSTEVGNLRQAVTLLGIKPLKLLVLGFSLPSGLFAELAGEQLERYWATALVRAVAARAIAEQFYQQDGDDAFIAGLIDDIGMLAMLGSLGEPYARFLQIVWDEEGDVRELEREALGFDHSHLTAALLAQWKMPQALVRAVAAANEPQRLRRRTDENALPQILYLAGLMAGLVGRHRLNVLPELIEAGTELCGLDKTALNALVEDLEPKVAALADALQVRLPDRRSYLEILAAAQARLADLGEELAGPLARLERAEQLLAGLKVDGVVNDTPQAGAGDDKRDRHFPTPIRPSTVRAAHAPERPPDGLALVLERAVAECRAFHDELVVALIDFRGAAADKECVSLPPASYVAGLLARVCREFGIAHAEQFPLSDSVHALILPHCPRRAAIDLVRQVFAKIEGRPAAAASTAHGYSAGLACVDAPPKNFEAGRLFEAAQRCLAAARTSGGQIKSLEIC
jgi:HD-like signal output (HDOD) protein